MTKTIIDMIQSKDFASAAQEFSSEMDTRVLSTVEGARESAFEDVNIDEDVGHEGEELQELSKKTLKSYIKKSKTSVKKLDTDYNLSDTKKASKRNVGQMIANKKIAGK